MVVGIPAGIYVAIRLDSSLSAKFPDAIDPDNFGALVDSWEVEKGVEASESVVSELETRELAQQESEQVEHSNGW